jgi:hypothetical protein
MNSETLHIFLETLRSAENEPQLPRSYGNLQARTVRCRVTLVRSRHISCGFCGKKVLNLC